MDGDGWGYTVMYIAVFWEVVDSIYPAYTAVVLPKLGNLVVILISINV